MTLDNAVLHIPDDFICTLSTLGIISLVGEDAEKYLQGQVTANVETLQAGQATLACHCDFKGKVWAVLQILKTSEGMLALTHNDSLAASLPELKKFGVFSKVEIEDVSSHWVALGGRGNALESLLVEKIGQLPQSYQDIVATDDMICINNGKESSRYTILASASAAKDLTHALSELVQTSDIWNVLEITDGVATVQGDNINEFVPQMLNMHALDAIDFTKGCYLGQEVVARTKYLGKNKRATYLLTSEDDGELACGDVLEKQVGDNWRRGGTVLRSGRWQNTLWALAVLSNDTEDSAILRAKATPALHLNLAPLPYSIDE